MLECDDLVGLGMAAHQLRLKKNDPRVVTYQIDRNINYTNFCTEYCFLLRVLPAARRKRRLPPFVRGDLQENRRKCLELGGTGNFAVQGGLATRTCRSAITKIYCAP